MEVRNCRVHPEYRHFPPFRTRQGGDLDSTEIWFRRMRAEDHHPRKTDGNQHNCEHAARSRSVKTCERPLRSACGPELDVI